MYPGFWEVFIGITVIVLSFFRQNVSDDEGVKLGASALIVGLGLCIDIRGLDLGNNNRAVCRRTLRPACDRRRIRRVYVVAKTDSQISQGIVAYCSGRIRDRNSIAGSGV